MKIPMPAATSGYMRDMAKSGMKIKAADADPRNNTGRTELLFSAVFLNIS
jgi:hypothetical protein